MCTTPGCKCKCVVIDGIDEKRDEIYYLGVKCDVCRDKYPEVLEE